jgi:hypothetical protein
MSLQRPEPDGFAVAGWRCPLCNATAYSQIEISRQGGTKYRTEFHECTGCTVMFRHPGRFARLGMPVKRWAADVEPRSLREVHGFTTRDDKPGS